VVLKKKRDIEFRGDEEPQLMKTGRFESYTVTHLENANTSDKETQIDHIAMLKEYDLIRYQQQHPDQFRPYVEMQRIRKESENLLSPNSITAQRVSRDGDRFRNEILTADGSNLRNASNQPTIREKTKIYRLPQYTNNSAIPGSIANENKSLLLAADDDNMSSVSVNQHSSTEEFDEVEDKMPEIPSKKKS